MLIQANAMTSLAENLRAAREAKKLSQPQLAKLSGVSQSLIGQIETGVVKSTKHIFKIAKALDKRAWELDPLTVGDEQQAPAIFDLEPPAKDFPLYTAAEGGDGAIILSWDPIEILPRPEIFRSVPEAYAMYVVGESMEPAYERGDRLLVNPRALPRPGLDVVLFKNKRSRGTTECLVKRLVRMNQSVFVVKQYNPEETFELSRLEWVECQVIVGKYNRNV